jgi:hypothetical protein
MCRPSESRYRDGTGRQDKRQTSAQLLLPDFLHSGPLFRLVSFYTLHESPYPSDPCSDTPVPSQGPKRHRYRVSFSRVNSVPIPRHSYRRAATPHAPSRSLLSKALYPKTYPATPTCTDPVQVGVAGGSFYSVLSPARGAPTPALPCAQAHKETPPAGANDCP